MKPWNYRPPDELDEFGDPQDGWEDNALSNSMAWVSTKLTPNWCQVEDHWTVKLALYFWADCPCCHFFRGVSLGIIVTLIPVVLLGILI